ncbi:MAG: hypothetical protein ABI451_07855, partial [Dokdonella sp.]
MGRFNRSFVRICRCTVVLCGAILLSTILDPAAQAVTFTVTNANDSGAGSLRQAIAAANVLPGSDTITFNIPGEGPFTIAVASSLPTLDSAITIDGYTQPGASANTLSDASNAVLLIRIDGVSAGAIAYGLAVCANTVIRGLSITRFNQIGVAYGIDAAGASCGSGAANGSTLTGSFL